MVALEVSTDVQVAREIQQSLQCTTCEDVVHLLVQHGDGTCTILQIVFDHSRLNGMEVMRLLTERSKEMMDIFFSTGSRCSFWQADKYVFLYRKDPKVPRMVSSMQEVLGAHIFHAPSPSCRVRDIYRDIFRLFASDFYMCLDLSHLFSGEPCMLRISYDWNRDFDEQWDEMICLKKSKDLVLCSWKKHLEKPKKWATHLPQLCSDFLPLYGSSTLKTDLATSSIQAVAFSLSAEPSGGCFFSVYPGEPLGTPSESQGLNTRFQDFQQKFHLEPSQLRVRPAPNVEAAFRTRTVSREQGPMLANLRTVYKGMMALYDLVRQESSPTYSESDTTEKSLDYI